MAHKKIDNPLIRARIRRKHIIRKRVTGTADKPRLSVFRSNVHIYVQAIDDVTGAVLAAASSKDKALTGELAGKKKSEQARLVGQTLGKRLKEKAIEKAVFDRNGFIYHGRVKQVAEGAREAGVSF